MLFNCTLEWSRAHNHPYIPKPINAPITLARGSHVPAKRKIENAMIGIKCFRNRYGDSLLHLLLPALQKQEESAKGFHYDHGERSWVLQHAQQKVSLFRLKKRVSRRESRASKRGVATKYFSCQIPRSHMPPSARPDGQPSRSFLYPNRSPLPRLTRLISSISQIY